MTRLKQKARRRAVAEELGISARGAANVIRARAHCEHAWVATTDPATRHCTKCGTRTTEAPSLTKEDWNDIANGRDE